MRTKQESIGILIGRWDAASVLEQEHLRKNLEKLKPETLSKMVADLQPMQSRQQRWFEWLKKLTT
ncbi:MAG: hypothetical protein Q7R71_00515 [bacterium]|nr:hypothetical protein [bacterium]